MEGESTTSGRNSVDDDVTKLDDVKSRRDSSGRSDNWIPCCSDNRCSQGGDSLTKRSIVISVGAMNRVCIKYTSSDVSLVYGKKEFATIESLWLWESTPISILKEEIYKENVKNIYSVGDGKVRGKYLKNRKCLFFRRVYNIMKYIFIYLY